MRFLASAQFVEQSRVADAFVAPSAALANRLLAARGLGRLPPCRVSYFIEELHRPGAAIGLHTKGTANIRLNLAWLADVAQRGTDPEWEVAFVVLHEYAHFVLERLEAREASPGAVRQRIEAEHADFLRRMQRLGGLADPVSRKLLSNHNAVAEEWCCDAFAYWAAGTLPASHAAFLDALLAEVRVPPDA
ncbi:hypothetical protein [Azospirillum canadense]|uniref:hypothetical protein n=1 Tax=Azospirillum canadense TaxID=403962 RepID=UPI002227CB54|nr:hypothetical protein [Azospirillum canadense]MCW2239341.1 hypothetical protein [Azospirillum canadense]